jgi:hypothetical protein
VPVRHLASSALMHDVRRAVFGGRRSRGFDGTHGSRTSRVARGIAADSQLAGGSGANTGRRLLSVTAMLLGATVGALLVLKAAPAASLLLAAGMLGLVCVGAHHAILHDPSEQPGGT